MNLGDLIKAFRKLADDEPAPRLWGDTEVKRYANEAERDAVERGFLIEDDETAEIVKISVETGKETYALDSRILKITRARLETRRILLFAAGKQMLDNRAFTHRGDPEDWPSDGWGSPNWDTATGIPYAYVESTGKIRLVGIPSVDDTLKLTVYRLPLQDMEETTDVPEIRAERHYELLDGMLARAYLKNDAETYNPKKAAEHEARFTAHFGSKIDANVRRKQRETRSHTTRINW